MSDAARRARVDALFDQALDLDQSERQAFLSGACEDAPLRAEVEELLRLAGEPAPALDRVAHGPLWEALAAEGLGSSEPREGDRVGAWRLVRELGRGGMGAVFLAERAEGRFHQRAALKLVRLDMGSEEVLRRFERERQILASLGHAHIARLLDGGCTEDGRPFLAMEYVDGLPIDRYCEENELPVRERLELCVRVGRALEHAHRNLVVHRDVKPSNIVVTAEGEVKLLDFGIAKLLGPAEEPELATRTVLRVLTPEYASPEQVRGEPITTASDVYQLGLLLYELLTGSRAQSVAGTSPQALERAVCEAAPPKPSSQARRPGLARALRGDLDTIVLRALHKEPGRRYASVADLIEDVERYRRGLPIRARADAWGYRVGKFARRHRVGLAWSVLVAAGTSWALLSLAGQRLRAAREAARADAAESLFSDLFSVPNPRGDDQPPTTRDYVDRTVGLVRDRVQRPATRGRLLTNLGRDYVALGAYAAAEEVLEEARAVREQHLGGESVEVAETLLWLGRAQHYRGRYAPAEATMRRSLEIRRRLLGADHPKTTRMALDVGDFLHTRGRLHEAEGALREVLAPLCQPGGDADQLFTGQVFLGNVLRDRGALREAESLYLGAEEQQRRRGGFHRLGSDYARLLIMKGDLEAAERFLRENVAKLRRHYAGDHPEVGNGFRHLGHLHLEQGRLAEAESALAEAQAIYARWLEVEHPLVPRIRVLQAELARRQGRPRDAVRLAQDARERFERLELGEHPAALDACLTLGQALLELAEPARAARILGPCLPAAERQYVRGDPRAAALRAALASARR